MEPMVTSSLYYHAAIRSLKSKEAGLERCNTFSGSQNRSRFELALLCFWPQGSSAPSLDTWQTHSHPGLQTLHPRWDLLRFLQPSWHYIIE